MERIPYRDNNGLGKRGTFAAAKTAGLLTTPPLCSPITGSFRTRVMTSEKQPIIIKKYANRRLYNTGSSTYVTLEDLAVMVKDGAEFVVHDAKSGEDITRSVLAQIIFDQEAKEGQSLMPIAFLRQLIRFYGDSMQTMIPSYLEHSMLSLAREQDKMRAQLARTFGEMGFPGMEDQARANMEIFQKAMSMFLPFGSANPAGTNPSGLDPASAKAASSPGAKAEGNGELAALKAQLADMQKKIDKLG
jgi:polyhydroxyalkanoate synthesis repressor PhaR